MEVVGMVSEQSLEATILRCTCGDPNSHPGRPCEQAKKEELGVIASSRDGTIKLVKE